jgi:hypothetical protein
VRKSVAAGEGIEGLAEVVGYWAGGDGLPSGLYLDGSISAGGLYEFPDRPAGLYYLSRNAGSPVEYICTFAIFAQIPQKWHGIRHGPNRALDAGMR